MNEKQELLLMGLMIKIHKNQAVGTRVTLEEGLKGVKGEKANTVYSLFAALPYNGSKFGTAYMQSDGGVQNFAVTYKLGEYELIVKHFSMFCDWPFDTIEGLIKWMQRQERRIKATLILEIEDE